MARRLKISASILNVRLHPHSPARYAAWIERIYSRKAIAQVHGDRYGVISSIDRTRSDSDIILGAITTFIKLDDEINWFNAEEMTEATEDDISAITIPANLHPNAAQFYFYFDTRKHRLYVQSYSRGKSLTSNSVKKLFAGLAMNTEITSEFGEALVTVVQEKSSIEKMFAIKRVKEVNITLFKPNSDIFDEDFESNLEEHLEKTHSREMRISYRAEPNRSIVLDEEMRRPTDAALTNGVVEVIGRDEDGAVRLSSTSYPKELHSRYDPDAQTERSAFISLASSESGEDE